jgi:hypothetical protein
MRKLHKTAVVTSGALGLVTAAAATLVARRRTQLSLQQQAAEVRKRYRQQVAAARAEGDSSPKGRDGRLWYARMDAVRELNDLRVRYLESVPGWRLELSPLDKVRISIEFGLDDPESVVPVEGVRLNAK